VPLRIEGRAVVGEFGLPGVRFLEYRRLPSGELAARTEPSPTDSVESDADGRFALEWKWEGDPLLLVLADGVALESAEGGEVLAPTDDGPVLGPRGDGPPVVLRFRPLDDSPRIRLLDARTGRPPTPPHEPLLAWAPAEKEGGRFRTWEPVPGPGGWIAIHPEEGRALRVLAEGYARAEVPAAALRGWLEVPLQPAPAAVRGTLLAPAATEGRWTAALTREGPGGGPFEATRLPAGAGPFEIHHLDPGSYSLQVRFVPLGRAWRAPAGGVWAVRSFSFEGSTVDLGEIRLEEGSRIRARVVGQDGKPLPGLRPQVRLRNAGGDVEEAGTRGRVSLLGTVREPPAKGREGPPDEEERSWVEEDDLPPGAPCVVSCPGVPGLSALVRAPRSGEVLLVEVRLDVAPVRCRFRVTRGGEEARVRALVDGAGWHFLIAGDRAIVGALDLFPGRQTVRLLVEAGEKKLELYTAGVEVPEGRAETDIAIRLEDLADAHPVVIEESPPVVEIK